MLFWYGLCQYTLSQTISQRYIIKPSYYICIHSVISQAAFFCDVSHNSDSQYQHCQIKSCSLLYDLHIYLINLLLNNNVSLVPYELKKRDRACVIYIHILWSESCGYSRMQCDEILWCRYCQHVCTQWGTMYIFITISST